jgi:hypothetical protein
MADLMIDLEGLATGPNTCILTIAAQSFDPFGTGHYEQSYYARITLESQETRDIDDGTIAWWATHSPIMLVKKHLVSMIVCPWIKL